VLTRGLHFEVPPHPISKDKMPKMKTHSGAKKRFQLTASGKVKRKQTRMKHLNSHMKSKVKRHLGDMVYVDDANMLQVKRQLVF